MNTSPMSAEEMEQIRKALDAATPGYKCRVDECLKQAAKAGYCHGHYKRLRRYGEPTPKEVCKECNSLFVVRKMGQIFCSRRCKERWTNKQSSAKATQQVREKKFRSTEKGKELKRRTAQSMYAKYKHKALARAAVQHAIRKGVLTRPDCCVDCGSVSKVEAHHHKGYDREHWLDVKWLCKKCHMKEDRHEAS